MPKSPNQYVTPAHAFARFGMALADWSERWFPDACVSALAALIVVFIGAVLLGSAPRDAIKYFGDGFWGLIPFTMQMAITILSSSAALVMATPASIPPALLVLFLTWFFARTFVYVPPIIPS